MTSDGCTDICARHAAAQLLGPLRPDACVCAHGVKRRLDDVFPATMSEPYSITVTRWVCGGIGCTRSYARRSSVKRHMRTCWKVPENRTCLTCRHFARHVCCDAANDDCGCRGEHEWRCSVGVSIEPGQPQVGCPKWEGPRV